VATTLNPAHDPSYAPARPGLTITCCQREYDWFNDLHNFRDEEREVIEKRYPGIFGLMEDNWEVE